MFTDWGGRLSARLMDVVTKLQDFYGPTWAEEVDGDWSFLDAAGKEVAA